MPGTRPAKLVRGCVRSNHHPAGETQVSFEPL